MAKPASLHRQRFVNTNRPLTRTAMGLCEIVRVVDDESRVMVVRAWRDAERIVVRVMAGTGRVGASRQWVFADIDEACEHIGCMLAELNESPGDSSKRTSRSRKRGTIRTVDADEDSSPT